MRGNIALLLGPEEGEKQEWIDREKAALKEQYPDLEVVVAFAFESDGAEVSEALGGASLFSSHTLVIVKYFEEAKKGSSLMKAISDFAKNPNEDSHLFIVSSGTAYTIPADILKAVPKENQITFWELFENKKKEWVRIFFRKEGFQINENAADLLLELIENNTAEMRNYCSQLALFFQLKNDKKVITEEDISTYLAHTKEEDGYTLFSYMAEGNLDSALAALKRIFTSDSRASIGIIAALQRQFRLLESFLLIRREEGEDAAYEKASALPSGAVAYEVKGIKSRRDKATMRKAGGNYTAEDVDRIIAYLDREDINIRKAATDQQQLTLEMLIYTIVVNKGKESGLQLQSELMDNSFSNL